MTQDELRKEFEAAYPMPEGIVRNQWGKYSPFDKETFLMTESLIYNVRYEVYQAAALKRDAEIAALKAAFSPRRWTKEQNQAWHENIPNLQSAFEALLAATYSQEGKAT